MAKAKSQTAETAPSFEAALTELQAIVGDLESGQLELEQAIARYEQGTSLFRHCFSVLAQAEQKIEQLAGFDASGNPVCEPFDATATLDQREQTAGRRATASRTTAKAAAEPPAKKPGGQLFTPDP